MTPELETLKRLHEAATPEPWETTQYGSVEQNHDSVCVRGFALSSGSKSEANRNILVTLRNLAPELIALLEAVEAQRRQAPKTISVRVNFQLNSILAKLREMKI